MATHTVYSDETLATLREARARGFASGPLGEELPTTVDEPVEPPQPHWAERPPEPNEKFGKKALRYTIRAGFRILAGHTSIFGRCLWTKSKFPSC
jgi:hypothetical protein